MRRRSGRARALLLTLCVLCPLPLAAAASVAEDTAASVARAMYASALSLIGEGRHEEALARLRRLQRDHPAFDRRGAVQTRVAVLQEARDAETGLATLLEALDARDAGEGERAERRLRAFADAHPESSLADDALYLAAYFAVMDRYAYAEARQSLRELGRRFPDTAYRDAAVYLDAIALEQLGETAAARTALATLRERHTALALPFDFRWPAGGVLSRYWFDRAERRLGIIERRLADASTLGARESSEDGRLLVDVNVGGIDLTLSLSPSPLVRETDWLDAGLGDRAPPALGVYEGRVVGSDDSWVRAVVRGDSITGLIELDGERHRLLPASLVGTLDYYRPRPTALEGDGTTLAELFGEHDALAPPPALGGASSAATVGTGATSDVRAIPLSVVVDSQYDRYHGGAGLAAALNDLNVADGIYRGFGLALNLDEVLTFDEGRDPMALGPMTLESLLRRFRDYRLAQRTLFEGSALTYLFSGNPKTDVTLGLAWIDTLCRRDGYDVGVTTPSTFGDVLLTHELGHSLGAQHDSDTACRADADYLMWPNISARTPTTLSACSEASVRRARARSCLLDAVDLSLALVEEGDAVRLLATNPDGALAVDATLHLEMPRARDGDDWPAGCVAQSPTGARCPLPALGAGETRELRVGGAGEGIVAAQLVTEDVVELSPEDNVARSAADGRGSPIVVAGGADATPTADGGGARDDAGEAGGENGAGADGVDPTLGGAGGSGASAPFALLVLGALGALGALRRRTSPGRSVRAASSR